MINAQVIAASSAKPGARRSTPEVAAADDRGARGLV
jgi:hypothetical protein